MCHFLYKGYLIFGDLELYLIVFRKIYSDSQIRVLGIFFSYETSLQLPILKEGKDITCRILITLQ